MFWRERRLGAAALVGLTVAVACTIKNASNDQGSQPNTTPGAGGAEAGAAPVSLGGKAGSGSAGKGGSAGSAGKAGGGGTLAAGGEGGGAGQSGAGGEAGAPQCPMCASGFCLEDGTCVDCLPDRDHCPAGQYCTDANHCEPGCKANGAGCVSGVCLSTHDCQNCLSDDECGTGNVCGNGQCAPACSEAQEGTSAGCAAGLTCCSQRCVDVGTDSKHCGACGAACASGQFCGLEDCAGAGSSCVSCQDTVVTNVCSIAKIVVILDTSKNPADGDKAPGEAMGAALLDQCTPTPSLTTADQSSVDAVNFTTGRPVSGGGELLIIAGGPFFQTLEGYLEDKRISPLYWKASDTASGYYKSSNDEAVFELPLAEDHDSHDFFIVQFMNDPASGSLVLNAQGLWLSGTVASAFVVTNLILPDLASYDKAWYAFEWTDMNGDKAPDLDEIVLKASGN